MLHIRVFGFFSVQTNGRVVSQHSRDNYILIFTKI
jgi:hypothetical protein